jgi:hypothetical protein
MLHMAQRFGITGILAFVRMRTLCMVLISVTAVGARTATAQALGYGMVGPAGYSGFFGSSASLVHAAGGAEFLVGGHAGAGGEFGVLANSSSVLFVFSGNAVLHLSGRSAPRSPFITGGYTHMESGDASFAAWNIGVGLDLWIKDHVGVRIDFRDHVRPEARGNVQYWTVRGGIAFR